METRTERLIYLRRLDEGQPIGWVCREQSHRLTFVDCQCWAQEVTDQVDKALEPLLTGTLQQLEGWDQRVCTGERFESMQGPKMVFVLETHWQTWTWGPGWVSRPSCRPSWWGRWRLCCLTCTWWRGSLGSVWGARELRPNSAVKK